MTGGRDPRVDAELARAPRWRDELARLRAILLDTALTEELKWRAPCYTLGGKNVAILFGLKESCGVSFFKGALLDDPAGVLTAPGEHTRAARMMRFTSLGQIAELEPVVRAYVDEAIAIERAGRAVDFTRGAELPVPSELQAALDADPALRAAFAALTPGRRREYLMHVAGAKQSATRASRVTRAVPRILAGKGLRDRVTP